MINRQKQLDMAREQSHKEIKSEKRRLEALKDLDDLDAGAVITGKRQRKPAQHRDSDYVSASLRQMADAGEKGGLVSGSGYHYDRGYSNQPKIKLNYGGLWRTEKEEEKECRFHRYR